MQKKLTLAKWAIMSTLVISLGVACKKTGEEPPPPVTPKPPAGFVYIKGGQFKMGSPAGLGTSLEEPQHSVILRAFFVDTTELTRGKFFEFLASSDTSLMPNPYERRESYYPGSITAPVAHMGFRNALLYCNWRSKNEGLIAPYTFNGNGTITYNRSANGYRLLTEAEWEYACRAGSETDFSFGSDGGALGDYAWYSLNSDNKSHPVALKKPNAFGLYDMHGNAGEWVWDFFGNYSGGELENPTGPTTGTERVYRGGTWKDPTATLRSSNRFTGGEYYSYEAVGIRLARNI